MPPHTHRGGVGCVCPGINKNRHYTIEMDVLLLPLPELKKRYLRASQKRIQMHERMPPVSSEWFKRFKLSSKRQLATLGKYQSALIHHMVIHTNEADMPNMSLREFIALIE